MLRIRSDISIVVAKLEHRHKCLGRHLDATKLTHLLLTFLLLFKQLLLTGNVTAVALCKNVLAECLYGLAGDDTRSDSRLDRDLEELTRNVILESFRNLTRTGISLFLVNDK